MSDSDSSPVDEESTDATPLDGDSGSPAPAEEPTPDPAPVVVTAQDLIDKFQHLMDVRNKFGVDVAQAGVQKAEYDAAHDQAMNDSDEYAAAFVDAITAAHNFNKDDVTIP